jgi:hypothetical protein
MYVLHFSLHFLGVLKLSRMRRDLLDKARITAAVEFIMETIEVDPNFNTSSRVTADAGASGGESKSMPTAVSASDEKSSLKLCLRKFDGESTTYTLTSH